ncbi:MAG: peroxiredoxin family protein [Wenzhouxiangellaceae bacterium]|nr:peroxiredoxin family protein [Wenzhouxiangellaceae bacterium]
MKTALKRWFITLYLAMLAAFLTFAALKLARPDIPLLAPLGLLVAAAAPLGFFGWLFAAGPARTDRHPVAVSVIAGIGAVCSAAAIYRYGETWNPYLAGGIAVLVGWLLYVRWYSVQPAAQGAPQAGDPLPDFAVETAEGERVESSALGGRPAVLVFYRGNWCPLCVAQIRELAAAWRDTSRDATLWFISNQGQARTRAIAERFDMPAAFLRDPGGAAAKTLGLHAAGATPAGLELLGYPRDAAVPTVLVVDGEGIVRFVEVAENYRLRPEPSGYLHHLDGPSSN